MADYNISYVLTTYNKLPYLQQVLGRLVATRQTDEEIIVCDGGSKDGTPTYLQELYDAGHIQQFVSERDRGEAHGFNKGMLMARGDIIKVITDDDAFCYPMIRQAAKFMIQNPTVDVVLSYSAGTDVSDPSNAYITYGPKREFDQWQKDQTPFWMVGLSLMIRRQSLPLTGLLSTGVVLVDVEYITRLTSLGINIAWCTGIMSMHVNNANGNYNRMNPAAIKAEGERVYDYYVVRSKKRNKEVLIKSIVEAIKRPVRPLKRALFDRMGLEQIKHKETFPTGYVVVDGDNPLRAVYQVCDEFMATYNANNPVDFLYKNRENIKVMQSNKIQ